MKKIIYAIISMLIFFSSLFLLGKNTREIKTEIYINAQPDVVWNVLTSFEKWTQWNSTVKLANGTSELGSVLNITINGNGHKDSNYQPSVIESNAPNIFRWRANFIADFVFKNDRVFILEKNNNGTILIHKEEFSGLMVPLMWSMLEDFVGPTLEKMNRDLKVTIENN